MNEVQFNSLSKAAETGYKANGGVALAGFDPITIVMAIISFIVANCPKKPTAGEIKTACDSPSRYTEFLVNTATRHELRDRYGWGAWQKHNGPALAKTAFDLGKSQPPEVIDSACNFFV